jgi:YNFM family putative membrane transporter
VSISGVRADRPATAGSPELRRIQIGMVAAGLAAFALLYATQALLPEIGRSFGVGAAAASLTVAVTTGTLALTVLPMSAFAERVGRTRVMAAGLGVACLAVAAGSLAPDLWVLLALRAVDGLALAGVVAVAMGHLGAEVDPAASGAAIGVYVSGTTIGGLMGRLVPAGVEGFGGWRVSLVALAGVGAICTLLFVRVVPASRAATRRPEASRHRIAGHLRDPGIVRLCAVALLLMGGFVATYNYLTYRLADAPFGLSTSAVGLVFLAYLSGTVSSTFAARTSGRVGRKPVVLASIAVALAGLTITLSSNLALVLVGLVVFTTGFFGAHSVASGWVTGRAVTDKSTASALYLMAYYLGSSLGGTLIGLAWTGGGWTATVLSVSGCYVAAAVVCAGIKPLTDRRAAAAGSPAV